MGFGHVVRSRALARALGVPHVVALRGTSATARSVRAMGTTVIARSLDAMARYRPGIVVIDDPSAVEAARAVAAARTIGVPVASVHDLGLGYADADLVIDASVVAENGGRRVDLAGPRFTMLDPALAGERVPRRLRQSDSVLIALGGGAHVLRYGSTLAFGICNAIPAARVVVAPGFASGERPLLPARAAWLPEPRSLARALARCAVAVVGGGVTVSEACALATPAVAVAVAPAQRRTILAFARAGAVIDGGRIDAPGAARHIAVRVARLLTPASPVRHMTERARALVDGRGAARVAAALTDLIDADGRPHAA